MCMAPVNDDKENRDGNTCLKITETIGKEDNEIKEKRKLMKRKMVTSN